MAEAIALRLSAPRRSKFSAHTDRHDAPQHIAGVLVVAERGIVERRDLVEEIGHIDVHLTAAETASREVVRHVRVDRFGFARRVSADSFLGSAGGNVLMRFL